MVETKNNKGAFRLIRVSLLVLVVISSLNLMALSVIFFRLWKMPGDRLVGEHLGRQLPRSSSYHKDYQPVIKFRTESMDEETQQLLKEHLIGAIGALTGDTNLSHRMYDTTSPIHEETIQMIKEFNKDTNFPQKIYDKVEVVTRVMEPNLACEVQPEVKFTPFEKLIARRMSERIAQWDMLKPDAKKALAEEIKDVYIIVVLKVTGDSLDYEYIAKNRSLLEALFRACSWNDRDLLKDPNEILQLKSEYFQDLQEQVKGFQKVVNNLLTTQTER